MGGDEQVTSDRKENYNFIVSSLPRSGSTTLARLLNSHKDLRCLIEPFHPHRYQGRFHQLAEGRSLNAALDLIWSRWTGIKHVWESNGWPFLYSPELNDQMALGPSRKIIVVIRRNLLRRVVSNVISRQTRYWIGTRAEFVRRLEQTQLKELDPWALRAQIRRDKDAIERQRRFLSDHNVDAMVLYYEDVFCEGAIQSQQLQLVNRVLTFLQAAPIAADTFAETYQHHFDPDRNRWATAEVYRRIPGIERIEQEVGSHETGWLFR
jgi:hypothetical protein